MGEYMEKCMSRSSLTNILSSQERVLDLPLPLGEEMPDDRQAVVRGQTKVKDLKNFP